MPTGSGQHFKEHHTVLLMHLPDPSCVAARPYYIVVKFRKICRSRELRSGDVTQRVEKEIVSRFSKLVDNPSTCQDTKERFQHIVHPI